MTSYKYEIRGCTHRFPPISNRKSQNTGFPHILGNRHGVRVTQRGRFPYIARKWARKTQYFSSSLPSSLSLDLWISGSLDLWISGSLGPTKNGQYPGFSNTYNSGSFIARNLIFFLLGSPGASGYNYAHPIRLVHAEHSTLEARKWPEMLYV